MNGQTGREDVAGFDQRRKIALEIGLPGSLQLRNADIDSLVHPQHPEKFVLPQREIIAGGFQFAVEPGGHFIQRFDSGRICR
ncbi:hypothetical protein MnTg04_01620 [bacterium MnTg04]|nr:hypothetical protein MnTg04_01620 [bacterium MnTg04]